MNLMFFHQTRVIGDFVVKSRADNFRKSNAEKCMICFSTKENSIAVEGNLEIIGFSTLIF